MLISGFSPAKELSTRANAACGRENCRIRKKILAEKKFPDTCGHGLNHITQIFNIIICFLWEATTCQEVFRGFLLFLQELEVSHPLN